MMSMRCYSALVAALAVPALALAQNDCDSDGFPNQLQDLILASDFESGSSGWTLTGLWNVTSDCQSSFGPAVDGSSHAYFGIPGQCNYDNGSTVAGSLASPVFTIPAGTETITVFFDGRLEFEEDFETVTISLVPLLGGTTFTLPGNQFSSEYWTQQKATFTGLEGTTGGYRVIFDFNSVDAFANSQLGWQIDNVSIVAANFPDADGNLVHDMCDLSIPQVQLDFEEGDLSDLLNINVGIYNGSISAGSGPSGVNFNVGGNCLTTTPDDQCGNGDFVMQFADPAACDFIGAGGSSSGWFLIPVTVPAGGESTFFRFCSKYDAEGGEFDGTFSATAGGEPEWGGTLFDRAGVAIFDAGDITFSNPRRVIDVSGTTPLEERGEWKQYERQLDLLGAGDYFIVFGYDSEDATNNDSLGWQIDNIIIEVRPEGFDANGNDVPDNAESLIGNFDQNLVYASLNEALDDASVPSLIGANKNSLANEEISFDEQRFESPLIQLIGFDSSSTNLLDEPFVVPTGAVFSVADNSDFAFLPGGNLTLEGELVVGPEARSAFPQAGVTIQNFGVMTLQPNAFVTSQSNTVFVANGTLRMFDATFLTSSGTSSFILVGSEGSRNSQHDARLEVFGSLSATVVVASDGQIISFADTEAVANVIVEEGGQIIVQNGVFSFLDGVLIEGEIIGQTFTPANRSVVENGGRVSGQGLFFSDDASLSSSSALRANNPSFVLNAGGDIDIQINDNDRFEFGFSELRLNAFGSQTFEALSRDRGPSRDGLDPSLEGSFPIGTLRVGPLRTRATLVDNNDNDTGASSPEVIYARNVIVEPGATLDLTSHVVYYESSNVLGVVLNPSNLIALEESCPSDVNSDGRVDIEDLLRVLREFNSSGLGDTDGDNDTDIEDLLTVLREFGTECP